MVRFAWRSSWAACVVLLSAGWTWGAEPTADQPGELSLVVMDPLAAPLSCPCVEGYAQRKYEQLAEFLQRETGRRVKLTFAESLANAVQGENAKPADVVIGKDSVVRYDAAKAKLDLKPVARLTGKDGSTTQTGLFVVPAADPARELAQLQGYRLFLGTADSEEKHQSALAALRRAGVPATDKIEISKSCSDGACRVLELAPAERAAAVISSYAQPLLEGCGTIDRGALRVVGRTENVPFITAFVSQQLAEAERAKIAAALLAVGANRELCTALETLLGFVPIEAAEGGEASRPDAEGEPIGWTGWRGEQRDAVCRSLAAKLSDKPDVLWHRDLPRSGLGGIAATDRYVIFGDRDTLDFCDVFHCLSAADGTPLWSVEYPAVGELDYGNSPRATPLIHGDFVFLHGAFGDLHCVRLQTGETVWARNLRLDFNASDKMVWGMCSSPLIVDGKLIVNPGTPEASLAALDPRTGEVIWQTPGDLAGFGSLIAGRLGGVLQIVGHDRRSLGGWDAETGRRLWKLVPPIEGDFNVPTPVIVGDRLLITTENNGTRLYAFEDGGKIVAEPVAQNDELAPDMSTPVVVGSRVFCVWGELFCLDAADGLKTRWTGADEAFGIYGAVIASGQRVLAIGRGGQLVLADTNGDRFQMLSKLKVFGDAREEFYSHPALVGNRLYIRGTRSIVCLELAGP
jgi:outer membrane protein assembly factor BamB/ABC-type phosphate/phosphonate transport system substrate-binding protein